MKFYRKRENSGEDFFFLEKYKISATASATGASAMSYFPAVRSTDYASNVVNFRLVATFFFY
jgi:hypothetical protein